MDRVSSGVSFSCAAAETQLREETSMAAEEPQLHGPSGETPSSLLLREGADRFLIGRVCYVGMEF